MWDFDPERVRENVRQASTEDLLDRLTAYRAGMEPEALRIIEEELRTRGVTPEQVDAHSRQRDHETIPGSHGVARKCSFCQRPAVEWGWGWQRLWRAVPLFPRVFYYCEEHRPRR